MNFKPNVLIALVAAVLATIGLACGGDNDGDSQEDEPLAAAAIVAKLVENGIPITSGSMRQATPEEDTSLGRDSGYDDRMSWRDNRVTDEQRRRNRLDADSRDGEVIVFYDEAGARAYAELSKALASSPLSSVGYHVQERRFLIRLAKEFTPEQADEYAAAFREALNSAQSREGGGDRRPIESPTPIASPAPGYSGPKFDGTQCQNTPPYPGDWQVSDLGSVVPGQIVQLTLRRKFWHAERVSLRDCQGRSVRWFLHHSRGSATRRHLGWPSIPDRLSWCYTGCIRHLHSRLA
jgi:hypothetical protein